MFWQACAETKRLQACVDRAYSFMLPMVPVLLPSGTYLVRLAGEAGARTQTIQVIR